MSLEQAIVQIVFVEDAEIGVLHNDEISYWGTSPRPEDGNELGLVECNYITPACERCGIVVDTKWDTIPIFEEERMTIRVLEASADDDWVDCILNETEYSEYEGMLARIPKESIKIISWVSS